MALVISNVPVLTGEVADRFVKEAEYNAKSLQALSMCFYHFYQLNVLKLFFSTEQQKREYRALDVYNSEKLETR